MLTHLFDSTITVLRQTQVFNDGIPTRTWTEKHLSVKCRLDLHHRTIAARPERVVMEAGVTPDLIGTIYLSPDQDVLVGDRLKFEAGPHEGRVFSVEDSPAVVSGFSGAHHKEWAVMEVASAL